MKLKYKALADVTLVPVVTVKERTTLFRVDLPGLQAGFVEQSKHGCASTFAWRAYRGINPRRLVSSFFPGEGGIDAAVACVLDRSLIL